MKKLFLLFFLVWGIATTPLTFASSTGVLVLDESSANVYPDGVYYDSVIDHDQTSEASTSTEDDVYLPYTDGFISGTLYLGSNTVFDEILFDVTTAGDSSRICVMTTCHHYDLEYYNGEISAWESLSYTDESDNFEVEGLGTWTFEVPSAWDADGAKTTVNGQTLFWVRLSPNAEATITTPADAGEIALHAYNLELTIEDELGNALDGLVSEDFTIDGGTSNNSSGMRNLGEGVYQFALDTGLTDSNYTIAVNERGYVEGEVSTGVLDSIQKSFNEAMQFSHVISVVDQEGNGLTPDSVALDSVDCVISGSRAYCPFSITGDALDDDVRIIKSGYVTLDAQLSASRDDSSDPQVLTEVELELDPDACTAPFDDISGHWAEAYIVELYCRDVVNGEDANTFNPSGDATRAEFLKMAILNAGYSVDGASGEHFSDVDTDDWFYEYVAYGVEQGMIEGYEDGTFLPNEPINRAEALVITMRIAGIAEYDVAEAWNEFEDVTDADWFAYAVETASDEGIVEGYDDGTFRPGNNITRAEVAAISVRTYNEYYR